MGRRGRPNDMRFIGSKANLLGFLDRTILEHSLGTGATIGDLFCGTASVSAQFKTKGLSVVANDNLYFCALFAKARLRVDQEPGFQRLIEAKELPGAIREKISPRSYDKVLWVLNQLDRVSGFIYKEYSPGGTRNARWERKYFTDENAKRIDAVRTKIAEWVENELLTEEEEALLVTDLLEAVSQVSNIAGTYGFFLKEWGDTRPWNPLELKRSRIIRGTGKHQVYCEDALQLVKRVSPDILYFDPPYTWRHYGAYYHVLETIARWDSPEVSGKSGLRSWEDTKSPFCYPDLAASALDDLLLRASSPDIFLSYGSEGLLSHEEIVKILSRHGELQVFESPHRRYKSSATAGKADVVERLYHVRCG